MSLPKELTTVTAVSKTVELIVLIAAIVIGFGVGVNYQETIDLLKQQRNYAASVYHQTSSLNPNVSRTPTGSAATASPAPNGNMANWKTYKVKTLQLQFRLPPKFTQFGELKENVETVSSPFAGKRLCATFLYTGLNCEMNHFLIAAISSDYNVGRGAGFVDLQGFTYVDGRYYARLLEKEFEIPSNLVQRINNKNGLEIIRIKEKYNTSLKDEPLPIYYAYSGENTVGALVSTSDRNFPGFAVLLELKDGFTEEDFDQILSAFKFTQ